MYKEIQHKLRSLLRHQHTDYLTNILSSSDCDNRKLFWKYIKNKRKDSVGISTPKSQNSSVVSDPTEKSEIFNHQFKSVFTIEDTDHFSNFLPT